MKVGREGDRWGKAWPRKDWALWWGYPYVSQTRGQRKDTSKALQPFLSRVLTGTTEHETALSDYFLSPPKDSAESTILDAQQVNPVHSMDALGRQGLPLSWNSGTERLREECGNAKKEDSISWGNG